jgi:hypothetical protein
LGERLRRTAGCSRSIEIAAQHITDRRSRDNEDPYGRSAYDAAARSIPAEFGISTSISKVETLSPRSIRT